MKNRADGSYLNPNSANNTQLRTSADIPDEGWTIKAADAVGYTIITSGTVELNQTNSGLSYKIYNWGDGTNISDTGCKYKFVVADKSAVVGIDNVTDETAAVFAGQGYIDIIGTSAEAEVYSPVGTLLAKGNGRISLSSGPAIVKLGDRSMKVMVL